MAGMKKHSLFAAMSFVVFLLASPIAISAQTTAATAPTKDSSYIDSQGTAHVTRIVPIPQTVSPQAQQFLARPSSDAKRNDSLEQRRKGTDTWQARAGKEFEAVYPVNVAHSTIAGVPVLIVTPLDTPAGEAGSSPDQYSWRRFQFGFWPPDRNSSNRQPDPDQGNCRSLPPGPGASISCRSRRHRRRL